MKPQPVLSLAALLLGLFLSLQTPYTLAAVSGYTKLVSAVNKANKLARVCQGKQDNTCLGKAVTVVLNQNVVLEGPLPVLNYSAHLIIKGACPGKRNKNRCVIDGQLKYQVFPFLDYGPAPSLLEIDNLIFERANGGVLANTFSTVVGNDIIFRNNINGVIQAQGGGGGGKPQQTYTNTKWVNNNGTAIAFGSGKFGLSYNGTGLVIKRSVFYKNSGSQYDFNGGAITLSGAGTSTFENVQFTENLTGQSGGAIWASQTTVKFREVTFTGNTAQNGGGGAVYGESSFYYAASFSFCSCTFSGNTAPKNPKADTLDFEAQIYEQSFHPVDVAFCDTPIPPGSILPAKPNGTVTVGSGRRCFRRYC